MTKVALQGGAYTAHSVVAAAQRCVNLVPEPVPEAQGEPMPSAAYPTPGTRLLGSIGPGPIRGIRQSTTGAVYVVSGSNVYLVTTAWTGTLLGSITAGLRTPVSMADNGLDMVIVDGTAGGWRIALVGNVFAPIVQTVTVTPAIGAGTAAITVDGARYTSFTPSLTATISDITLTLAAGYAGHMKCAVFDAGAAVLGFARVLTNPATGANKFTFDNPISVSKDTKYWVGFVSDTTLGTWSVGAVADPNLGQQSHTSYDDFPVAAPDHTVTNPVVISLTLETDPAGAFAGADRVDFLDTYLLFNKPNTPQFYSSDSLALTFDPLWFANKESYSDLLQTLVVAKRNIWLFGAVSTEVWANVGKPDFPFESQGDVFIDHGVVAKYSVAEYDNGVFWLSRDRQGQGIVIMGAGYQTKRVSTYAIEAEIAGYERISDAIGYCYQLSGHAFYVLIFPHADKTWSYDITTGLWHEWVWLDANGDEHRHRSNCYWPINGIPVVGDWQNGNLYALDQRVFTDNGQPIKRVRSFPHILADGKRVFFRSFVADFDTGNTPQADNIVIAPAGWPPGFTSLSLFPGGAKGSAYAVSGDGNTVVGASYVDATTVHACYWTPTGGPNDVGPPGVNSGAYAVSADGLVIVGVGLIPFRWTAATGPVSFGVTGDNVRAISADGSRIVGEMNNTTAVQACYWNSDGSVRTPLGFLPGHDRSQAAAVSADGSVIVGASLSFAGGTNTQRAWRWTAGTGMVSLGLVGPATASIGFDVSDDGSVVVGQLFTPGRVGFRWTAATGMVLIGDSISHTPAISGDGTTIMAQTWYVPDPDTYVYTYLGYIIAGELTIPVPVPLNPAYPGLDTGTYPYDGCISSDGRVMAGWSEARASNGNTTRPFVYSVPGTPTTRAVLNRHLISLSWSNDAGHTYGNPVTQSIGEAGEYLTSLQWNRLAYGRSRVFKLEWSVPMRTALLGCYFDATPAQS